MFFIGTVRRFFFINGTHRWNAWVRDITAWLVIHVSWLIRMEGSPSMSAQVDVKLYCD